MPIITRSSYSELPEWLRNYAQEAAIAARNLGLQVTPPAQGSPAGTLPTVGVQPYRRYTGERFAPINPMERRATDISSSRNPIEESMERASRIAQETQKTFHEGAGIYASPHTSDLLNAIQSQAQRRLKEDILPALEAKYMRLGQHGSLKHRKMAARMARDLKTEIAGLKLEASENAYEQAMKAYNQDQARLLEAARIEAEHGNLLNFARTNDINTLLQSGAYYRKLQERPLQMAEEEFRREQRHPYEAINFLISALNGIPVSSSTRGSVNIPSPPSPPTSMRGADYAGLLAQLAPSLIGQRSFRRG